MSKWFVVALAFVSIAALATENRGASTVLTAQCVPCVTIERTATGVRLVKSGKVVWNFEIDTEDGKPYVHPLVAPSGLPLTELRPKDHPWHKGLWFSWKFLNGANCWETPDKCGPGGAGRTILKSKDVAIDGLNVKVNLGFVYCDRDGEVLAERRKIAFPPPDENGGYLILSEHEFTVLRDVVLDRTPPYAKPNGTMAGGYAGLTLRLNESAADRFVKRSEDVGNVEFADPVSGECISLIAYEQPKSAKFYAWPDRRMLNLSPIYDASLLLKAGEKLRLRYAVKVKAGK